MAKYILEREKLAGDITGTFSPFLSAQDNKLGSTIMLRNNLTALRIELQFGGIPTQLFTLEPGEHMVFGDLIQFTGQAIEIRTVASIPESIRLNLIG